MQAAEHPVTNDGARSSRRKGGIALPLALTGIGGGAIGLIAWGWMQFGEAIYLNRLAAFVVSCF